MQTLKIPEEIQADIKAVILKFILFSIILNSLTWYPQIKCYLYGATKAESHFYWTIALNVYALNVGASFGLFTVLLFPMEKILWIFLFVRLMDVATNFADQEYIDKYDMLIWCMKLALSFTVFTIVVIELRKTKIIDDNWI